jgi:Zn-dependent protease with chaperone function
MRPERAPGSAGDSSSPGGSSSASGPSSGQQRPAATAAARISRASLGLGFLGLAAALFVVARLLEAWRVTPAAGGHRIVILGQRLSYPVANLDAIVVVALAALGVVVTVRALTGAVREARASRRFHRIVSEADLEALASAPDALLIADEQPRAFCAGLLRPQVYVSTGAVTLLDDDALNAVLAHERHHVRRRDPLRLAVGRVLAQALFFVPGLGDLVAQQQALAELGADETAVNAAQANRSALARAMLSFADVPAKDASAGIDPARVDYLLGEPPSWQFPALLCLAAACVLALVVTVAVLVGQEASGAATLAPPFLSRQPCIVILAATPVVLGALAATYRRSFRLRSAPRAAPHPGAVE